MAFSNLKRHGVDSSDMHLWARSGATNAFIEEVQIQKELAFKNLLKGGSKNHDMNSECYKAYEKVLKLINEAGNI